MATYRLSYLKLATLLIILFQLVIYLPATAQTGSVDSLFGINGWMIFKKDSSINGNIVKILPDSANNYYVVYQYQTSVFPGRRIVLIKYLSNGIKDSSYGINGSSKEAYLDYTDAAIGADGKVVIVGNTVYPFYLDTHTDILVFKYNLNGNFDSSFNQYGSLMLSLTRLSYDYAKSIKLSFSGNNIIVGGYGYSLAARYGGVLLYVISPVGDIKFRVYLGEQISIPFTTEELTYTQLLAIQNDKIVIAGNFYQNKFSLSRYKNDGYPDSSFNGTGILYLGYGKLDIGKVIAIQGDKILMAGYTTNAVTGTTDFSIIRYTYTGKVDSTFNGTGQQTIHFGNSASAKSIIVKDDKIIIGGTLNNDVAGNQFAIAQLDSNGTLDKNFGINGKQTIAMSNASLYLDQLYIKDKKLYAAGIGSSTALINFAAIAALTLEDLVTLTCTANKIVFTDKLKCSSVINNIDPIVTTTGKNVAVNYHLSGATSAAGVGNASGVVFNKGITTVTYSLANNTSTTSVFTVTVIDNEPPVITDATASITELWPANHTMRDVTINYNLSDNCTGTTAVISVTSNEPETSADKDDLDKDWQILDAHTIRLRAEKNERGTGRIYTVTITATDGAGNKTTRQILIKVPANMGAAYTLKATIYPNPSTTYFNITTIANNKMPINIKVTDCFGRFVEVKNNLLPNTTIQLGSSYRCGLYFIEIMQGNNKINRVLIKTPDIFNFGK